MKTVLNIGSTVTVELPWSEVCMHMKLAGQRRQVRVLEDGAQILDHDGSNFSFPVTWGEAGIYRDSDGQPYVHLPPVTS